MQHHYIPVRIAKMKNSVGKEQVLVRNFYTLLVGV